MFYDKLEIEIEIYLLIEDEGCPNMSMAQEEKHINEQTVGDLMIPAEKVAHVQLNNPLEHALLVLVKSGYFAVPVLDASYKLVGSISKTIILDQILGLDRYEFEKLSDLKVHEVMETDTISVSNDASFIEGLKAIIDIPYACVVDADGFFDGILTRRAILKEVNKQYYSTAKWKD